MKKKVFKVLYSVRVSIDPTIVHNIYCTSWYNIHIKWRYQCVVSISNLMKQMYLDSYNMYWMKRVIGKMNSIINLTNGTSKFCQWTIRMIEMRNIAYVLRTNITFVCIRINETRIIWSQMPFSLVYNIFFILHIEHVKW